MDNVVDRLAYVLRKLGCAEKRNPEHVSSARVIAYAWALTTVFAIVTLVLSEPNTHQVAIIAEAIGGTLTALGLRSKSE